MATAVSILAHMSKHYSDWHINHALEYVIVECENDDAKSVIIRYARARRKAEGFDPRTYEPNKASNSHRKIPKNKIKKLEKDAKSSVEIINSCVVCGEFFESKHKDATQCGLGKCRTRASRLRKKGFVVGRQLQDTDQCPHGHQLKECAQIWCSNRLEDLNEATLIIRAPEEV